MKPEVDTSQFTPAERIAGDDEAETAVLREMLLRAEKYMKSFCWCPPITDRYLALGVGGVIALFLFRFEPPVGQTDDWLWVVEGDLPSAYFVTDRARNVASALNLYCEMMERWADAVMQHASLGDIFPISVPPTEENAEMLRNRVRFLRERLLPNV